MEALLHENSNVVLLFSHRFTWDVIVLNILCLGCYRKRGFEEFFEEEAQRKRDPTRRSINSRRTSCASICIRCAYVSL